MSTLKLSTIMLGVVTGIVCGMLAAGACGRRENVLSEPSTSTHASSTTSTTASATGSAISRVDTVDAADTKDEPRQPRQPRQPARVQTLLTTSASPIVIVGNVSDAKPTAVASATNSSTDSYPIRNGFAIPIMYDLSSRFRINVLYVTLPVPQAAWDALTPQLGIKNGQIPIAVWRIRGDKVQRMTTHLVPARPTSHVQHTLDRDHFRLGDVAVIECNPGLFSPALRASVIDNISSDPSGFPLEPMMVQFRETAP